MNQHMNAGFYIPQREPFIMVGKLIGSEIGIYTTQFTISDDNIFLDDKVLSEFALIENIGQSFALGLALSSNPEVDQKADGYLGAAGKVKLYRRPVTGETIQTEVRLITQLGNLYLISGSVSCKGEILLECELKLAQASSGN